MRQDLNESTKDLGLNLNANDEDSENNPKGGAEPLEEWLKKLAPLRNSGF